MATVIGRMTSSAIDEQTLCVQTFSSQQAAAFTWNEKAELSAENHSENVKLALNLDASWLN